MNQIFGLIITIVVMLAAVDIMTRQNDWWSRGFIRPLVNWLQRQFKNLLRWALRQITRQLRRFVIWAGREFRHMLSWSYRHYPRATVVSGVVLLVGLIVWAHFSL